MQHVNFPYTPREEGAETVQIPCPQFESLDEAQELIGAAQGEPFDAETWEDFLVSRLNVEMRQGAKSAYTGEEDPQVAEQAARDYMIGKPRGARGVSKKTAAAFQEAVTSLILSGESVTKTVLADLRATYGIPEDWTPDD